MDSIGWRRDGAGRCDAPVAAVCLLQGNKSRDKLLAVNGAQALPAGPAGLAQPASAA